MIGALCAFLSSVTWAIGSTVYSRYSEKYSSFSINFVRALIALPLFLLAEVLISGWGGTGAAFAALESRHYFWLFLSMVASYAVGDALFFLSVRCLGITTAMAIASVYPLWLALIDAQISGEPLVWARLGGVITVVAGVITVILAGHGGMRSAVPAIPGRRGFGIVMALLTSFFWTLNSISVSRGGKDISPFIGNFVRMTFAMILLRVMFSIKPPESPSDGGRISFWIPWRELNWKLLIFAGEAFGGSALFLYGLSHSPLAISGTLSSLAPVLSVPIGLAMGVERFSVLRTIGVVLVCVGTFFLLSPTA